MLSSCHHNSDRGQHAKNFNVTAGAVHVQVRFISLYIHYTVPI